MSFGRQPGLINNCENTHLLIQVEKQYRCLHPLLHKSLLEREVDTHTHTHTHHLLLCSESLTGGTLDILPSRCHQGRIVAQSSKGYDQC